MIQRHTKSLYLLLLLTIHSLASIAQAKQDSTSAAPYFKDGQAQIVAAFQESKKWIRHDLWVETSFDTDGDGKFDRMHVSVTRPYQTESMGLKLPIIYETSPYYAGVANDIDGIMWDVKHELGEKPPTPRKHPNVLRTGKRPIISNTLIGQWVPRGFIVVHSSSPGTGLSQGAPTVGGINESLAPKAVIEWLSGKDNGYTTPDGDEKINAFWSSGNVGMTGTSYNGTLPIAAATTGVDGLKAIIPIAPNTSYYHYYRSNGLVRSPGGYLGEDVDVLYDFIHSGAEDKRPYNNKTYRDDEIAKGIDRESGDYNAFWAGRDYLNAMKSFKAALLMAHGFNDWNVMPEHSYRIYNEARAKGLPVQIYYHQGGHGGEPPHEMMNKWFTRFLFNIENGVEKDPKSWVVRENDKQNSPTSYTDYPNPEAIDVKFYLGKGGNSAGTLQLVKPRTKGSEVFVDDVSFSGQDLAKAKESENRLLYVSQVLKQDLHISGIIRISVKLALNKPAANFSVWLVALPWSEDKKAKITDNIITRGWADPQNFKSITKGTPLKTGKFYDLKFDLQPDDQIIPAGKQIGLMLFSSDKEFTLWPKAGTEITIDLNSTSITVPIVGGKESLLKATE